MWCEAGLAALLWRVTGTAHAKKESSYVKLEGGGSVTLNLTLANDAPPPLNLTYATDARPPAVSRFHTLFPCVFLT